MKRILIVEDEKSLQNLLKSALSEAGYEIQTAENGKDGLDLAISFNPNLILLDLLMPIMDGNTMLKHLRALPQFEKTPVIVLTNAGNADNMRETQRYFGVKQFLIKSNVNMQSVLSKVKSLI
jgi:two-component system, chemotaxis family, chemotaxis protein CheY